MSIDDESKVTSDPFWLKKVFPNPIEVFGYAAPPVSTLFSDSLFVLDTNALLAPYQVGKQSVGEIERIYNGFATAGRLFVADQSVREFGKNRGLKLAETFEKVQKLTSSLPKVDSIVCPMLEGVKEFDDLLPLSLEIRESIKKYAASVNALKVTLAEWGWNDRVSKLYKQVFTVDRIIKHSKTDEVLFNDLKWRYLHKVPPGYKDKAKVDGGIGDLDIWYSILQLARDRSKHVIFVCNETKHDWVYRSNDQVINPRMELLLEFQRETGQHFGLIDWPRFLELAGAVARTIREARSAVANNYEHFLVEVRLRSLLDDLHDSIKRGPKDRGQSYGLLDIEDLRGRVDTFMHAKKDYLILFSSPTGQEELDRIEVLLNKIVEINAQLEYLEARQKVNGDSETAALRRECGMFNRAVRKYRQAIDPG